LSLSCLCIVFVSPWSFHVSCLGLVCCLCPTSLSIFFALSWSCLGLFSLSYVSCLCLLSLSLFSVSCLCLLSLSFIPCLCPLVIGFMCLISHGSVFYVLFIVLKMDRLLYYKNESEKDKVLCVVLCCIALPCLFVLSCLVLPCLAFLSLCCVVLCPPLSSSVVSCCVLS
jgi:hypothetical protein